MDPSDRPAAAAAADLAGVHRGREVCRALLRQALLDLGAPEWTAANTAADTAAEAPAGTAADTAAGTTRMRRRRPRQVWLVDRHFADWPLDDPAVLDCLSRWLRPGGCSLVLIGLDFDSTARALPRFARWRRDWSHRIEAWCPADRIMPAAWRGMVVDGGAWQWLDAPDWRLRQITDPVQIRAVREEVADFLQRCDPAWPATTLGL